MILTQSIRHASLHAAGFCLGMSMRDAGTPLKPDDKKFLAIAGQTLSDILLKLPAGTELDDLPKIEALQSALEEIARHTDPDGPDGTYRRDSTEDACDYAHAVAIKALAKAKEQAKA